MATLQVTRYTVVHVTEVKLGKLCLTLNINDEKVCTTSEES
jgi:hypothetical protein